MGLDDDVPTPCFAGRNSGNQSQTEIVCAVSSVAEESPAFSGNHECEIGVTVRSAATRDPADGESAELAAMDLLDVVAVDLHSTTLAESLTAAVPDLTVFTNSVRHMGQARVYNDEAGAWEDTISLRLYACPSTLA